jgi:hypothetical protein
MINRILNLVNSANLVNLAEDWPGAEEDLNCDECQVRGNGFSSPCHLCFCVFVPFRGYTTRYSGFSRIFLKVCRNLAPVAPSIIR